MTVDDRLHVQMAFIKVREALAEVDKIRYKDTMLYNVGLALSRCEDVMRDYVGPSGKE